MRASRQLYINVCFGCNIWPTAVKASVLTRRPSSAVLDQSTSSKMWKKEESYSTELQLFSLRPFTVASPFHWRGRERGVVVLLLALGAQPEPEGPSIITFSVIHRFIHPIAVSQGLSECDHTQREKGGCRGWGHEVIILTLD